MNVSRKFLADFAYLANHYGWTPDDVEQLKADTRANSHLVGYWTVLAQAHRDGYEQTAKNGYLRLFEWLAGQGRSLADELEGGNR